MQQLKKLIFFMPFLICLTRPAFAGVLVTTPVNPSIVSSPFPLTASVSDCSGQKVDTMGYSLDYGATTILVSGNSIQAQVTAPAGGHTLHVKSWGKQGAVCVTDVDILVFSIAPVVPVTAESNAGLQAINSWSAAHDLGTPGTAAGITSLASAPSLSGNARQFSTSYSDFGGERFYVTFGDDTAAKNFVYDTYIYIADSSTGLINIEMDMNQVMSNGQTVIYGFQCDGWSKTWDYTGNAGTPENYDDVWLHSSAACDPQNWSVNAWHHVQISYSRDDLGNVTYNYVALDGAQKNLNITTPSAFALGWSPVLLTNFQIDGSTLGSGSTVVYMDDLTISRW